MSQFLDNHSMEEIMTAWGRWAGGKSNRSAPLLLGYKSFWSVINGLESGRSSGVTVDCDTDMMCVDNAMSKLRQTDKTAFKVLKLRYLYGYSYSRLASKLSKDLAEYAREHKLMCHKTAKIYVDDAHDAIREFLKTAL